MWEGRLGVWEGRRVCGKVSWMFGRVEEQVAGQVCVWESRRACGRIAGHIMEW